MSGFQTCALPILKQFIESKRLLSIEDKVIVALSGGADSVALLRLLLELDYHCEAAHCNFHLRDEESDRDELFVHSLCESLNVPLHTIHFETKQIAKERCISIEMAARELRYNWFEELRKERNAQYIAVAHHQDDSAETILLNLIRGTGIKGLLGIRAKMNFIIRPLLCLSREDILDYLNKINQVYVTDSSNLLDDYTRNKIRLNLIPLMKEINPSVINSLLRTADHLTEVTSIYENSIADSIGKVLTPQGIFIEPLLNEPAPETILFEILNPYGFNSMQIKDIYNALEGQPGKFFISKTHRVIKDRAYLIIENLSHKTSPRSVETFYANEGIMLLAQNPPGFNSVVSHLTNSSDFVIPKDRNTACFDSAKINQPLTLRKWRKGDTFVPFGMTGKKKISDYLTDRKFSLPQKEQQWVLCCGDDIIWLVGERTDNRYRITSSTINVLKIELIR